MDISSNPGQQKLLQAIRDQTDGIPAHMVFVIDIVSVRFGGSFTPQIKAQLQRFQFLQMLTLNDCEIKSLNNFPRLPRLIRLDLVFNQIVGEDLIHLQASKHLQTLMLGANKIEKLQHLNCLTHMRKLLQIDLINNPVSKVPGFRNQIFRIFPSLTILDTLDRGGKDAYSNAMMVQAVSRVPDNLFDKSLPPPLPPRPAVSAHEKQKKKLSKALARTGSIDSIGGKVISTKEFGKAAREALQAKKAKAFIVNNRSRSSKAGLVFPVGRIRRHIKGTLAGLRVGSGSAVYMAAILEYLSAQLLQIAGNEAKKERKHRITPLMLRNCLKTDFEMNNLLRNVTFGTMGE